jgi:predicted esterase
MPGLDALAHVIRPAAGEPEAALVLMHGRGTNERDLAGLLGGFSQDPVIGIEFGRAAREFATEAGAEVVYRESAAGHFIDPHVVPELTSWVQERRASAPLA